MTKTMNDNELMIEAIVNFISTVKKNSSSQKKFEECKKDVVKYVMEVKKRIGDTDFLNSKEWKAFIVQQKINDIEKDFTNT